MDYTPPFLHRNPHLASILPNQLRPIEQLPYKRKTIATSDGDFLDLDIVDQGKSRCVLLLHGLEGDSESTYIRGMAKAMLDEGFSIAAMNQRGCSGRPNKRFESYHSGKTEDLHTIVAHLLNHYSSLSIIGFSLGANIALKYAGEQAAQLDQRVKAVIAISTPCDLSGSCTELNRKSNTIYRKRFLKQLIEKVRAKNEVFPEQAHSEAELKAIKSIRDFDDLHTAPVNGYRDAEDYYARCSSNQFIPNITVQTLVITAKNDPFLSMSCIPWKEAEKNSSVKLLISKYGGHVGFAMDWRMKKRFWHEEKVVEFLATKVDF